MPPEHLMDLRTVAYVLVLFVLMTLLVRSAEAQPGAAPLPTLGEESVPHGDSAVHVLPPPRLRSADIAWTKRLWRDIPLDGRIEGVIRHPDADFALRFQARFSDDGAVPHAGGMDRAACDTALCFLRLREAWHFDRAHGVLRPRFEGMGIATGPAPGDLISWVDMAALRPWLAAYPVVNGGGLDSTQAATAIQAGVGGCMHPESINVDAPGQSMDQPAASWYDVLTLRHFAGRIVQERNVLDRSISDYASGEAAFAEHARIEAALQEREAAFWRGGFEQQTAEPSAP